MPLVIKLRDGFRNNTVIIRVNGEEIYHKSAISTDLTISVADIIEISVEETLVNLEVTVLGGQTSTQEIQVQETPFVDVWIIEGRMELRASKEDVPML